MRAGLIKRLEVIEKEIGLKIERDKRDAEYSQYFLPSNYLEGYQQRFDFIYEVDKEKPITLPVITLPSGIEISNLKGEAQEVRRAIRYADFHAKDAIGLLRRAYAAELIEAIEPFYKIPSGPRVVEPIPCETLTLSWVWQTTEEIRARFIDQWNNRSHTGGNTDGSYIDESGVHSNRFSIGYRINQSLNFELIRCAVYLSATGESFLTKFLGDIEKDGWHPLKKSALPPEYQQ